MTHKKLTLKQAQEQNKLEEFIQQQEDLEAGNEELFDNTLKSMLENKSGYTVLNFPKTTSNPDLGMFAFKHMGCYHVPNESNKWQIERSDRDWGNY
jgi:hypothetical protein